EGIIDDCDSPACTYFRFSEGPPATEVRRHHLEIIGGGEVDERVPFFRMDLARNVNWSYASSKWHGSAGRSSRDHTRESADALDKRAQETGDLLGGAITALGQWDDGHDRAIGIEAQIYVHKREEGTHQQSRPGQEH